MGTVTRQPIPIGLEAALTGAAKVDIGPMKAFVCVIPMGIGLMPIVLHATSPKQLAKDFNATVFVGVNYVD